MKSKIISFTRDHTKMLPGIYLSATKNHRKYGTVTKFDLRMTRPNQAKISPKALHSLEHLLAVYFSDYFQSGYVDLSPMGCRTGFYLTLFGKRTLKDLPDFQTVLAKVRKYKTVPFATKKTCGSADEHNLTGALKVLEKFSKLISK